MQNLACQPVFQNSIERSPLLRINKEMDSVFYPAGISARILLSAFRLISYEPSVTLPDTGLKVTPVLNKPKTKGKLSQAMLHVFPNPADDYIIIAYQLDKEGELSIVSQDGRIVHSQLIKPGYNQVIVRVGHLSSGIYIVRLVNDKKPYLSKFTVK